MNEILMQLGEIGRLKTKEVHIETDKKKKKTTEGIKAEKAIEAYEAAKKAYDEYIRGEKRLEFIKKLQTDPEPNTKPLGRNKNKNRYRKGHGERSE